MLSDRWHTLQWRLWCMSCNLLRESRADTNASATADTMDTTNAGTSNTAFSYTLDAASTNTMAHSRTSTTNLLASSIQ